MKNLPKKIYLQVDPENECDENTDFNSLAGVSWCEERINDSDIEYVLKEPQTDYFAYWRKDESELFS
jgi:hypothetical protein